MRQGWLVAVTLTMAAIALPLQGQAGPVVETEFSNPGLIPSHWMLLIHPDGSGHFSSERGNAPNGVPNSSNPPELFPPDQNRDVQLSAKFADRVFRAARSRKWFGVECESHLKVAFQGWKKLSYSGPEGAGSCKFNYSNDKEIQALGDSLVAVASTILEGARLELLLQHDRLGLDKEMEYIVEAAGDGRMQQVCAIRGTLEKLAENPAVMERVRRRASILLARKEE